MAKRNQSRWQDLDHSAEPLLQHIVLRASTRTTGPIPEFLAKKAAEREPKTLEWYRDSLTQLWAFLELHDLVLVGDLNEHNVNAFRVYLRSATCLLCGEGVQHDRKRGVSENTVSNRLRAIRAFGNWMTEKGWTPENPLEGLQVPQSTKPEFDLIADDQRRALFDLYPHDTFLGSRNLAMLGILSDTGLRREEVVNSLLKNVDLDARTLKVYSDKTEEFRYLPLTDEVVALVRNYLKWRERYFNKSARRVEAPGKDKRYKVPRSLTCDRLFVSWRGTQMKPQALGLILYRASKKVGGRIHPHLFRHDWITRKALDGENPSVVKRWAGHKSYAMTDYYFEVAEQMLGAIKPKRSVLASLALPGVHRRGRPSKAARPGERADSHVGRADSAKEAAYAETERPGRKRAAPRKA